MAERNRPQFGDKPPRRTSRKAQPAEMFPEGADLPIFSGTPQEVVERPFEPEDHSLKQTMLPGMPAVDYEHIRALDQRMRQRKQKPGPVAEAGTLWRFDAAVEERGEELSEPEEEEGSGQNLADVLASYQLDTAQLRRLVTMGRDLSELLRTGEAPEEVHHLVSALSALLRPGPREQIRSPADAAACLMIETGNLSQEQLRVLCLDTKNRIQSMVMVYQGSLNASMVRIAELFREPLRLNSAGIILSHNHPSGDPTPSPEDVFLTRQVVEAGKLLDCELLDHLIIGSGKWVSLRQKGLGFDH